MFAFMQVKGLYRKFLERLQGLYSLNEATVITDWVFENRAGIGRSDMVKAPELELSSAVMESLESALQELLNDRPVQYVLGEAWFYKMKLKVNENVMVPRPETEELVAAVLSYAAELPASPAVLDIGTGSGCIPIAIKKNMAAAKVTAVDVSEAALAVARENAVLQGAEIDFMTCNFLEESEWEKLGKFDVIVSNPPYVPLKEKETMENVVLLYEPHVSIFVPDNDPQMFYSRILKFATTHLLPGGKICVETSETNARGTYKLFKAVYDNVELRKDLYGKERMVIVTT